MFAAGHIGGFISFWALDDGTRAIRKFEPPSPSPDSDPSATREPIFKVAWSAFPTLEESKSLISSGGGGGTNPIPLPTGFTAHYTGGETALTILGGLPPAENGISVIQSGGLVLPTLPSTGPTDPESGSLHADLRNALVKAAIPIGNSFYPTESPVDDFILLPRSSPHFNGTFDPIGIFMLSKSPPNPDDASGKTPQSTNLEAYEFPPPIIATAETAHPGEEHHGESSSVQTAGIPLPPTSRLRLPSSIYPVGLDAIVSSQIVLTSKDNFARLIEWWVKDGMDDEKKGLTEGRRVTLRGGIAYPNFESADAPDQRLTKVSDFGVKLVLTLMNFSLCKYEPYRLLVSLHADDTIRFQDISSRLLSPSPLRFEYPQPLPHLTIDLSHLLSDPSIRSLLDTTYQVQSVHFAHESLECAILLRSGIVVIYKFGESSEEADDRAFAVHAPEEKGEKEEIVPLRHLANWNRDGFKPVCLVNLSAGAASSCAMSDIGGSLFLLLPRHVSLIAGLY
jgi:syntaxin-binding protein 5